MTIPIFGGGVWPNITTRCVSLKQVVLCLEVEIQSVVSVYIAVH